MEYEPQIDPRERQFNNDISQPSQPVLADDDDQQEPPPIPEPPLPPAAETCKIHSAAFKSSALYATDPNCKTDSVLRKEVGVPNDEPTEGPPEKKERINDEPEQLDNDEETNIIAAVVKEVTTSTAAPVVIPSPTTTTTPAPKISTPRHAKPSPNEMILVPAGPFGMGWKEDKPRVNQGGTARQATGIPLLDDLNKKLSAGGITGLFG